MQGKWPYVTFSRRWCGLNVSWSYWWVLVPESADLALGLTFKSWTELAVTQVAGRQSQAQIQKNISVSCLGPNVMKLSLNASVGWTPGYPAWLSGPFPFFSVMSLFSGDAPSIFIWQYLGTFRVTGLIQIFAFFSQVFLSLKLIC